MAIVECFDLVLSSTCALMDMRIMDPWKGDELRELQLSGIRIRKG